MARLTKGGKAPKMPAYNKESVDKAIRSSRQPISKGEARNIHRLLKGRHGK